MKKQDLFLRFTDNLWNEKDIESTQKNVKITAIFILFFTFMYSLLIWISYFNYSFLGLILCLIPIVLMYDYVRNVFIKTSLEDIKSIFKAKQVYYCFVFFVYFSLKIYYNI